MGRASKLTDAVHEAIIEGVRNGLTVQRAAVAAGIDEKTVEEWIARGEGRDSRPTAPRYAAFAAAVSRARAEGEQALLERVRNGLMNNGEHDWRASAWLLERTRPETYGQTVQVRAKVDAELDAVVERLKTRLDPETFLLVASALAEGEDPRDSGSDPTGERIH